MGVLSDVTEQQQLLYTLRRADRRKDEFLATLAHELRNPLAVIQNSAELLLRGQVAAPRLIELGEQIQRQAMNMGTLLEDLLDVSRIAYGKLNLRKGIVNIGSVVRAALELAQPHIDARGHVLELLVDDKEALFEVDAVRVTQILANFLVNAAKYTDPGGHISLSVRCVPNVVRFSVTDDGVGLSPDVLPSLFEMFRQFKGTLDRAQGGLGVGLAVGQGLAELHGGTVEAFSGGLGRGSTFVLSLPRGGTSKPVPESAPPRAVDYPEPAMGFKLMVVDDNVEAALAMSEFLEMDGYEVLVAHSGEGALAVAPLQAPLAALLDIGLGSGMKGYELARKLRAIPGYERIFLIAITGWGGKEDRIKSAEAGFDLHLTKPTDLEALVLLLAERFGTVSSK